MALPKMDGKGYRETPDCLFPEVCKCEDCIRKWGSKKLALEVDNFVFQKILNQSYAKEDHINEEHE